MLGRMAREGSAERGACECAQREETRRWVYVGRGFMTSGPHMSQASGHFLRYSFTRMETRVELNWKRETIFFQNRMFFQRNKWIL